jgi:hypothetical protein
MLAQQIRDYHTSFSHFGKGTMLSLVIAWDLTAQWQNARKFFHRQHSASYVIKYLEFLQIIL